VKAKLIRFLKKRFICSVLGHSVDPGDYVDSHGNHDSLPYCVRCGEYDVSGKPVPKQKRPAALKVPEVPKF